MAAACGDVVLRAAVRAALEPEAVVALLAVAAVVLQPALTAAAVVLNDVAVFGALAPEQVGEAAGRAEHLHRLAVAVRLADADLRREQIVRVAGVVEDQAILLVGRQPQPAADDLLIQADGLGRAQDRDQIDVWRVEAGGQYRDVDQIAQTLLFERLDQRIALGGRRFGADQRGLAGRQQAVDLAGVLDGGGEDHHPFAVFGVLHNLADDVRRDAVLPLQLAVQIRFAEQAVASGFQPAEIVLHDRHVQPLRRHQKPFLII